MWVSDVIGAPLTLPILRAPLPKLRAGEHRAGPNAITLSWFAHMALGRAVNVAGLWPWLRRSSLLLRVWVTVMGGRVGRGLTLGRGTERVDIPLLHIGDETRIALGAKVGEGARVGKRATIAMKAVAPDTEVPDHANLR